MDECLYEPVNNGKVTIIKTVKTNEKSSWKPLLRQVFIFSGVWSSFFTTGLSLGGPTVIIPQLRREANSTDAVSVEMASWISSIHGYAAMPWLILPFLASWFGRKYPFLLCSVLGLVSFIFLYCSVHTTQILIGEILQGPLFTCSTTVSVMIVVEYSSPKHRGLFLTLKSATFNWGIWFANILGTFFHWKYIAVAGVVCSVYSILLIFIMCESPSWLAFKHRYKECIEVHRWIKGEDAESEKELAALLKSCKIYQEEQNKKITAKQPNILNLSYKTITEKAFYMPVLLSSCILCLYHISGKMVCNVYAIDIIKNITLDESTAYTGMLLLDGITVAGMYIGSGLSKTLNRRTLLLTGSCGGVLFLFILSLYLYLVKLQLAYENKYLSLALLTFFFLFISVGPIILSSSIYGELVPLRYRTTGMMIVCLYSLIMMATTLKTAPLIFRTFEMHGAFLYHGSISCVFIFFIYKFLPETKDKTLLEIEEYFTGPIDKTDSKETELINVN